MARLDLLRLLVGFRRFRGKYFDSVNGRYRRLSTGQSPKTLVIACSDSRVDPALLTSAAPGELFVVRNVANLVPPFESTVGFHGISSSIEFAVTSLRVKNILVMGHRQCGGIRALMASEVAKAPIPGTFIGPWMSIAREAALETIAAAEADADFESLCRQCEMTSILASIKNLKTFPFVREAVENRGLALLGAYFDLERGEMFEFDEESGDFRQLLL